MGKIDAYVKDYMSDNTVFADAFNQKLFGGKQVIKPEKLHPVNTEELMVPYGTDDAKEPVQRVRDDLRELAAMEDDNAIYLLLGGEYQANIHYAMPVKSVLYDALNYAKQVENARKSYKADKDGTKQTSDEYLSGFRKEDRLIPVITLTIYFGADKWDAPMSLHEMFSDVPDDIKQYIPDYRINLIAPHSMTDDEIDQFHSSLREVIKYIKYSKDEEKLEDMVNNDSAFESVDPTAARVINILTDDELEIPDGKEAINVCKAHEEMKKKAALKEKKDTAERMLKMKQFDTSVIAQASGLSEDEVKKIEASMLVPA